MSQNSVKLDNLVVMLIFHVFSTTNDQHKGTSEEKTYNIANETWHEDKKDKLIVVHYKLPNTEVITHCSRN